MPPEKTIKKRRRRRKRSSNKVNIPFYATIPSKDLSQRKSEDNNNNDDVEYIVSTDIEGIDKPEYSVYSSILEKFNPFQNNEEENNEIQDKTDENINNEEENENISRPSKKQRKRDKRDKIEVLKLLSDHPEIVEIHDVNSPYPWLLVDLKSYRNTVPVPRHWCQRRKFLQGKRGVEKPPFELPDFIKNTGIADIRQAVLEKEESQKLKSKARERLQPKIGKIDIDYHVLYDAFFRYQTKPTLTDHSDLYYEGKEYEVNLKERKPGVLSSKLRLALGMPEHGLYPPPWLVNMQRIGPPPAYPHLSIPGLNAPIPPGAKTGFHIGGWGNPPVDSAGRPLYSGDFNQANAANSFAEPVDNTTWGLIEDNDESDEEDYITNDTMDEDNDAMDEDNDSSIVSQNDLESGIVSIGGYETPETIDLRKQKLEKDKTQSSQIPQINNNNNKPKQLYQELKEEPISVGNSFVGSHHRYVLPKDDRVTLMTKHNSERMEVSLDPNELINNEEGITEDLIRKKYDDSLKLEKQQHSREDMSDLVAKDTAKRRKKEQRKFRF